MGRTPCCAKVGLNRGAWTALEDKILADYIQVHGEGKWKQLPKNAGLKRCGKSCRLRWLNYLRPDIKRGNISEDEEELIVRLHKLLGNRWSLIAGRIPGRTDNEIKNYWNTNLSKKTASSSSLSPVAANPNKSSQVTEPNNATANNARNRVTSTTTAPNSSTQVFRTRATRCSKVIVRPQPPPPPPQASSNVTASYDQVDQVFFGDSLFSFNNDLPVQDGFIPNFTNLLDEEDDIDDLNLEDFCLSDFLNNDDQFDDDQSMIITENEKDHGFSETVHRTLDGHDYQGQMRQSSTYVGNVTNPEPQQCPLFTDSYDNNWDL